MSGRVRVLREEIDRSPNPVFATDENNRIVVWNRAVARLFGYSREDAVGSYCHQLLSGRDSYGNRFCDRDCTVLRMARRDEPVRRFDIAVRSASGKTVHAHCTVAVLPGSSRSSFTLIHVVEKADSSAASRNRPDARFDRQQAFPGLSRNDVVSSLTPRERQILRMLVWGSGTLEIADALSISATTVRTHIRNTLKKMGVHSRLEAVVIASRTGLVQESPET